ncbi:hypothetical protein RTP6_007693 [Batrachochytrium dendrobatidis]
MQELTYNTDEGVKVLFEEMTKLRKALERMNVVTSNSEFFRKNPMEANRCITTLGLDEKGIQ